MKKFRKVWVGVIVVFAVWAFIAFQKGDEDPVAQKSGSSDGAVSGERAPANEVLVLVEREIACAPDPSFYPGSNHYIKNGAGETLFKVDPQARVQPCLAKGSERVDAHTWKVFLRPEAKFWSGKEVDADAVIGSLERSRKSNVRALPFLEGLRFKALDKWTVEVRTKRKNAFVPLDLSYMELCIFNSESPHTSVETMDMTGMYRVIAFEPKQRMTLEINPLYYGKKPTIKRIVHEEISDPESRSLSMLSGRGDIVFHISNESLKQLEADPNVILHMTHASNTVTIYLNIHKPQLVDRRVRQALSWGVDRDEVVLVGTEGRSVPTTTWLSSNPKFRRHSRDVYDKHDPEKAAALLDEAGWRLGDDGFRHKDGKTLSFKLMTWGNDKAIGESVQNQWTKLGVKTEVHHGDYSLIEAARETGDWDGFIEKFVDRKSVV